MSCDSSFGGIFRIFLAIARLTEAFKVGNLLWPPPKQQTGDEKRFWVVKGQLRKQIWAKFCFECACESTEETKRTFEGSQKCLGAFVVFWKLKKWLAKRFNAKICFGLLQKGWNYLPRLLATFWKGIVLRLSPKKWREDEILSMFGQTTAKGTILRWDLTFKTLREQQETLNCHFQTRDLLKTAWKYQLSFPKSRKTHKNHSPFLQEAKEQQNLVTLSN